MKPYEILHGDSRTVLADFPDDHFDGVVTDPPYELNFMNKSWDKKGVASDPAFWREVLRVMKPGAHCLAFGGTRTFYRMMCAMEDSGLECRDTIGAHGVLAWNYGSGFPKSLNVSKAIDKLAGAEREIGGTSNTQCTYFPDPCLGHGKENSQSGMNCHPRPTKPATEEAKAFDGWGTALKPSFEPIALFRKPLDKGSSVAKNVLRHGTGALNIDACRIPTDDRWEATLPQSPPSGSLSGGVDGTLNVRVSSTHENGRWPPNSVLIHSPFCTEETCVSLCPVAEMDRQSGHSASLAMDAYANNGHDGTRLQNSDVKHHFTYGDEGGASRYFPQFRFEEEEFFPFRYEAKPSKAEKNAGLEQAQNTHPTTKPVALMRFLCRLITPPGGLILDPFAGSGTTGCAAMAEGFRCVLIDAEEEYIPIITGRVEQARLRGRQLDLLETA